MACSREPPSLKIEPSSCPKSFCRDGRRIMPDSCMVLRTLHVDIKQTKCLYKAALSSLFQGKKIL